MDEKVFVERMEARDPGVFRELMPFIKRLSLGVCHNFRIPSDLREDVVQEVALKVFRSWRQFQGRSQLGTWIHSIARNQCLDTLEKSKRQVEQPHDPGPDDDDGTPLEAVDLSLSNVEQMRCVQAVLAELDREPRPRAGSMRKIDLLRFWVEHGPSTEELADFLKTTMAAAKERKRYLLAQLRTMCRKHCGTDECGLLSGANV